MFILVSCLICFIPLPALATNLFEETTPVSGISHKAQSYGASWGDVNGDGWPDIWVGNHNSKPSLYLNNKNGTFTNIIDQVWSGDAHADTHGAAWADFDNDGDQDLIELVGALKNEDGTFCFGCGLNHLYVNENGKLVNRSSEFGLDVTGLARTPLWFDANNDGKLDLLVVNTGSKKKLPTSTIFTQQSGKFSAANKEYEFKDDIWSRRDKYMGLLNNYLNFKFSEVDLMYMHRHQEFATLSDLNGNKKLSLILFSMPGRTYDISQTPFSDITAATNLPALKKISDVAVEDFNGDGLPDMYLTVGDFLASDVIGSSSNKIKGSLAGHRGKEPRAVSFRTDGQFYISIYPSFLALNKVFLGKKGQHPETRRFLLDPANPLLRGEDSPSSIQKNGVSITYDEPSHRWTIRNYSRGNFVDFLIDATNPVSQLQTIGFGTFIEKGTDVLLLKNEKGYKTSKYTDTDLHTACHSSVAGDFDNDMDIDIYLVCTGPIENISNRLLLNDGKGRFQLMPDAGGAPGSHLGRGDIVASADYDRDGFLDLFITNGMDPDSPFVADGPHQLYRNRGNNNHWLEIDLEGVKSNRDGIGASITLETNGHRLLREQRSGMHRITQNHKRIHFGLGPNKKIDHITINWPSGHVQILKNVKVDQIIKVKETQNL